uniref:Transcription factor MYB1R1 n=1 Tax=Lycoris radiata TaxID=228395 RepID=A0A1P7XNA4_LYCRD|nr:transcription factor MYB1R1 [Lycoris radiata]
MEKKEKGLKLFGVRIKAPIFQEEEDEEEVMRKSFSTGNLASCVANQNVDQGLGDHGYLSDGDIVKNSRKRSRQERKRGVPWTEEEHRTFLAGLQKLGKGDWRGISRNFVITRTPTQVASHAQKYFLRQTNPNKKKRRSSLFDVGINDNKVDEVIERTDHQSRQNNLVRVQSLTVTSTMAQVAETSHVSTLVTNNSCVPNLHGVTHLGGSSKLHSESRSLAANSDILQHSQHYIPIHHQPIMSSSLENNVLELSIALPQPHPLANLPSQTAAGAIRVI